MSDPDGLRPICGGGGDECGYEGHAWTSSPAKAQNIATNRKRKAAQARLKEPAKNVFGTGPSKDGLAGLRKYHDYRGSEDFTYADAIEFAAQSDEARNLVCQFFAGTSNECFEPGGGLFDVLVEIAVGLLPTTDVSNCVSGKESCLWLLTNLAPPLKGLKVADNLADAAKTARKACSFTGDTKVLMADGTHKPIRDIQVGDQVLATDPDTGETGARAVTAVWKHEDTVLDLVIEGGTTVTTTEDHPFWSATDKAWQQAQKLDTGDKLLAADGGTVVVEGLEWGGSHLDAAYNLTVDDIHTYYVLAGIEALLVHNDDECGTYKPGGNAQDFDLDELAQLTHQHVGAGDLVGRQNFEQIRNALNTIPTRLPDQNAVAFEYQDVRVIINEDMPWRSTAFFQRK